MTMFTGKATEEFTKGKGKKMYGTTKKGGKKKGGKKK